MSVDFNASFSGSAETFGAKMTETPASMTASMKETGGGSASNYEALRNKPKINGHELIGDMTPAQLGITDDRHHTHKQAQAAKVWTVAHNLGKRRLRCDLPPLSALEPVRALHGRHEDRPAPQRGQKARG